MFLKNKIILATICALIAGFVFFSSGISIARAKNSNSLNGLNNEQLLQIIDGLKQQIAQLIQLINQRAQTNWKNAENLVGGQCFYNTVPGICTVKSVGTDESLTITYAFAAYNQTDFNYTNWKERVAEFTAKDHMYPASLLGLACLQKASPITADEIAACGIKAGATFRCNVKLIRIGTCSPEGVQFIAPAVKTCGNGTCESGETAADCVADCANLPQSCAEICAGQGYAKSQCNTYAISPSGFANQCAANYVNSNTKSSDCAVSSGIIGIGKACCCQKNDSQPVSICEKKYSYDPGNTDEVNKCKLSGGIISCSETNQQLSCYCNCGITCKTDTDQKVCLKYQDGVFQGTNASSCSKDKQIFKGCDSNCQVIVDCSPSTACVQEAEIITGSRQCCVGLTKVIANTQTSAAGTVTNYECLKTSSAICGNGVCDSAETAMTCPQDCCSSQQIAAIQEKLGILINQAAQNASTTPKAQLAQQIAVLQYQLSLSMTNCNNFVCGNSKCEAGETASNCPHDCTTDCVTETKLITSPTQQCCAGLSPVVANVHTSPTGEVTTNYECLTPATTAP